MFKEAKQRCNHLTVALHENPSLERNYKLEPVHNILEREEILKSIKYIDEIIFYKKESTFIKYLDDYDIRFLGEDYINGNYTGKNIPIEIVWIKRTHNYSTTKLKRKIYESILGNQKN